MSTTNINVRVDEELKKEAETLFKDLGLNMTLAITMFLRAAVNNDGIPFELKRSDFNDETKSALNEYREMKINPIKYKRYDSFESLVEEVDKDA